MCYDQIICMHTTAATTAKARKSRHVEQYLAGNRNNGRPFGARASSEQTKLTHNWFRCFFLLFFSLSSFQCRGNCRNEVKIGSSPEDTNTHTANEDV